MASVKRDDVKHSWEETEFPLVCETCLGDNPYVRMTKETHGKKCQVCETPFTVFAWQAGTKGRLKRVEICRSCAQARNVCQVCIYDLQYGLPVKVRDRVLRETGSGGAIAAVPQSMANRSWYTAQQKRALEQGQNLIGSETTALAHAKLQEMAVMEPRYERNLPKLCSFFAKGECDRGASCPFRHEMPRDRNDPMSKQNTKDRFFGTCDPVANKILGRRQDRELQQKERDANDDHERARATVYMRFQGDAPYPPLTEADIRDQFYSYGEIVSVRCQHDRGQCFVEYTQPEAAELAISSTNRRELFGRTVFVSWARAAKRGETSNDEDTGKRGSSSETKFDSRSSSAAIAVPPAPIANNYAASLGHSPSRPIPSMIVKPPPEVAAMVAARRRNHHVLSNDEPTQSSSSRVVPQPGGGPLRGAGIAAARRVTAAPRVNKPYYPSSDPGRLGTK